MSRVQARCWVCQQMEDEDKARETAILSRLVGHAAWAICIRCGQEVPDLEDPEYLARAKRHLGAIQS
ncbi:MAG: hypothetical protein ACE5HT_08885 [Gemmatimonadales bacterium]